MNNSDKEKYIICIILEVLICLQFVSNKYSMMNIHPASRFILPGLGSAADTAQLAGSCTGDLSNSWADLRAPRGAYEWFPAFCSLQVEPVAERHEELDP